MVWFQCEVCGENLKKPKLPNHFRFCSAHKLSCIDCGETFNQQSVQGHNQCITEAEKYGPKGQGKASNGTTPKAKKDSKQRPEIDINVGLSERPPWFCSLCNTNATSKQTLLLHAEGKKHRAKARAIHAANQQSKQTEESTPIVSTENTQKDELPINKDVKEPKEEHPPKVVLADDISKAENGNLPSNKKRKSDSSDNERATKKAGGDGAEIQNGRADAEKKEVQGKEAIPSMPKEDSKKKIKWKKFITSALKSNPDGVLKMKKLRKLVLEAMQESGISENEVQLSNMLEQKIQSSSRFTADNKYVRLVAKN